MAADGMKPGWRRVRFGDVVRLNKETSKDPAADGLERYVGLEHIEPGDLRIRSWGNIADGTTFTNRFRPGQVLFGKRRAYQRKVAVADFDGVCSGDIYVLEPKDPDVLLPELLPFICQTDAFFDHAVGTSAGSLSPRTNWKSLASYEFALPPLDEQRRLLSLLDSSMDTVNSYRELFDASLQLLKSLQKRFFIKVPEGVKRRTGEIADVRNGTTPRRNREDYWNGSVPWLPTGKVNERRITDAEEFITEKALAECSLSMIPATSTLIAMIGQGKTRGKAAFLGIDATINQNFAAVIPGADVVPEFLFYQLDAKYEELRRWSHGTNQHALNCKLVAQFPVSCPSIPRQSEIAETLKGVEAAMDEASSRRTQANRQLKALSGQLLAHETS